MRQSWIIAVVILTISLTACGPGKDKMNTLELNSGRIDIMSTKLETVRDELDKLNFNIRNVDVKITSFERKLNELTVDGALAKGSQVLEAIKGQLFDLDQRLAEIENSGIFPTEQKSGQSPIALGVSGEATTNVTIKILSATGELYPARALSGKLEESGYIVNRIDLAQSRFRRNTVFYSKGMRGTAEDIAGHIGARTTVKPLTWGSTFNIIVVVTH
jgi:hypothetical protein